MTRIVRLDLTDLPVFVATPLFCCIDSATEEALKPLPDTFSRLRVACRFLQRFGASAESLNIHDDELLPMWAGYLRAALMEYAGMEESWRADIRGLGLKIAPVTADDTGNAMLILMRELRNLHVHVVQSRFDIASRSAILRTLGEDHSSATIRALGQERETELQIVTIPRVDLDQLLSHRIAKRFDKAELVAAIGWLDDAQHRWGIGDVVLASLEQYSQIIVQSLLPSEA